MAGVRKTASQGAPKAKAPNVSLMPYSWIAGQEQMKLALELAYIAPRLGGVLLSGQRGTGKSTVVRAFGSLAHGRLPVTLPINATEDRVIGGWKIDALLQGKQEWLRGLLEEAHETVLYVDEVNLLDDHIVNIILDTTSTGFLHIEREGRHQQKQVSFTLIGTMNPSEGGLRPQLLDRFGLMADVVAEKDENVRRQVLRAVLDFDEARAGAADAAAKLKQARASDLKIGEELRKARKGLAGVQIPPAVQTLCVRIGQEFGAEGHRGDFVLALAAQALAARSGKPAVTGKHLAAVAPLALQHRRGGGQFGGWTADETTRLGKIADGIA